MDELISRYLDLITPYDGIGVGTDKDKYYDLIAAGENAGTQQAMGTMSGCALSIRGFWRLFGLDDKRITGPYKPGMAVIWLQQIAQERKAWFHAAPDTLPGAGDMVLVGGDKGKDGGVEHVFTVLEMSTDPIVIQSIDGGQVDGAGKQIIKKKQRTWRLQNGGFWDVVFQGTDPGSAAAGGRRVQGWACVSKILAGL